MGLEIWVYGKIDRDFRVYLCNDSILLENFQGDMYTLLNSGFGPDSSL